MGRLEILTRSLQKKELEFDRRISDHFADVQSANGQPLNDKRNGQATLSRWEKQDNALRRLSAGIDQTKRAIEREESLRDSVASLELPKGLRDLLEAGVITQWRRHPTTFFVPGVEKGRFCWDPETNTISTRYLRDVPRDQYPAFRDAVNAALAAIREPAS